MGLILSGFIQRRILAQKDRLWLFCAEGAALLRDRGKDCFAGLYRVTKSVCE
jgi:hypothetical protein